MKQKPKSKANAGQENSLQIESAAARFIDALPAYSLGLTLFLSPLSPDEKLNRMKLMVLGSGLILTGLLWALSKVLMKSWQVYGTPLFWALAVYVLSAIVFYKASRDPSVASSEFQRMIFSVGAFFVACQACSGERSRFLRKSALSFWMGGLFLISFYGILQKQGSVFSNLFLKTGELLGYKFLFPQMERVFGTFGNPIFFAAYLILSVPILIGWMMDSKKFWVRLLFLFPLATSLLALFYTGTRAAFLALPLSLGIIYAVLETSRGWRWTKALWRMKLRILAVGAACAALLFIQDKFPGSGGSFLGKMEYALHESRVTATSQTHTLIWKDVLKMWRAHKFFGTGYGTFHIEFPQYASEELKKVFPQRERIVNDAHNEFLQILAETGIVGFVIFVSVLFIFYLASLKKIVSLASAPENEGLFLFSGCLAGATALLMENFFSVDMRFIVSSAYLFLTMGLVTSYFAEPVSISWPAGWRGHALKTVWALFFLFLSGIAGLDFSHPRFYIAGIYCLAPDESGIWTWKKTPASGPGLFPSLVRPYLSNQDLARTPDFFDEKLLNGAQTIRDLEDLTRQFPKQWRYWEKLGYALAKEIQRTEPDGKKVNDLSTAEKAVWAYSIAYQLYPQAEGPPNNIGNIYYTIDHRSEAIGWWMRAIQSNPDKIDARLNLGLAYYYEGRIKESAEQFEEVLKRDPKNEKAIVMLKRMVE